MRKLKTMIFISFWLLLIGLLVYICNSFWQNRVLFNAIERNDYEEARTAIESGAFLNTSRHILAIPELVMTNPTPLITACKKGNYEIVNLLVLAGADINKVDNCTEETPLIAALQGTKQNRFSLAFYLIEHGADVHKKQQSNSVFQETLLVSDVDSPETVQEGFSLFQYLMEENVDISISFPPGNALNYAVRYNNYSVVKYFLENGYFAVNEKDCNGDTALIVASKYNRLEIAELLVQFGATLDVTDSVNKTAYSYAVENGYAEIAELLQVPES